MKKILISLLIAAGFSVTSYAASSYYYVACSTIAVASTPDINASHVYVKNIIVNTAGTAQTLTIYKNVSVSSSTAFTFDVPATAGWYYPLGQQGLPASITSNDQIDIPYFTVRSSTSTNPCKVLVIYGK